MNLIQRWIDSSDGGLICIVFFVLSSDAALVGRGVSRLPAEAVARLARRDLTGDAAAWTPNGTLTTTPKRLIDALHATAP
jgi:hypothetical protein